MQSRIVKVQSSDILSHISNRKPDETTGKETEFSLVGSFRNK